MGRKKDVALEGILFARDEERLAFTLQVARK
jgi:hypothetical protein